MVETTSLKNTGITTTVILTHMVAKDSLWCLYVDSQDGILV